MIQKQAQFVATPLYNDGKPRIGSILIANRGEIACRIIQTCRRLGITTIAIYTEADLHTPFVKLADQAVNLGSAEDQPYLNIDLIIAIAKKTQAAAIHPGYGYLSENANFARAVADAGIVFIGPSPESIAALGDKREAKVFLKAQSDVPLVPGYDGLGQDPIALEQEADKIGYPVMIKASAGGGGKGMRIVKEKKEFKEALERCTSEAQRLFGSAHCLIEKYIQSGKHVEIQIFGDGETSVSFLDRECSVQRRNQKVIEESPCAWLSAQMRKGMSDSALEISSLLKYESAGTVEFIVDVNGEKYYFLEVNTRIQVEHPITEEVVGVDLVALQIFVASGGKLSSLPELHNVTQVGHSIEVRLCAEDPFNDFRPCTGNIELFKTALQTLNRNDPSIRYELGMDSGSQVTIYFDSMISKIIVWAPDRVQAIQKMLHTLGHTVCFGLTTNQVFLQRILSSPEFRSIDYSTALIPSSMNRLIAPLDTERTRTTGVVAAKIIYELAQKRSTGSRRLAFNTIPSSFRNQRKDRHVSSTNVINCDFSTLGSNIQEDVLITKTGVSSYSLVHFDQDVESSAKEKEEYFNKEGGTLVKRYYAALNSSQKTKLDEVIVMESNIETSGLWTSGQLKISFGGVLTAYTFAAAKEGDYKTRVYTQEAGAGTASVYDITNVLAWAGKLDEKASGASESNSRVSVCPMPSKILQVLAQDGSIVKIGDGLLVLESMKTEIRVNSAADGKVSMKIKIGDVHPEGTVLCEILEE